MLITFLTESFGYPWGVVAFIGLPVVVSLTFVSVLVWAISSDNKAEGVN